MVVADLFRRCVDALSRGVLIRRASSKDKEFHFQNWFRDRLRETGLHFEEGGRNSYPDFRMVKTTEGFEVKGLAYPGRDANFDCNSQIPSGLSNGRTIFYVFGRYPKEPDGNKYPVLDLVVCHGDLLNADHEYTHKNKSIRCFGSYGDILIRDRKMYVVPTPYKIAEGLAHAVTLVLPAESRPGRGFVQVGEIRRRETDRRVTGYSFDLRSNDLEPKTAPNPTHGREHAFLAWRVAGSPRSPVTATAHDQADDADD